ncbi:GtrA family protein [Dyella amyloliquefaciens]|uniref:GtrA family protein n=1 Tax=Dyella amyloliquefaciens TaxID=1770545 RepID=UPI00102E7FB7|nr:GtrA family protein [Dyella amyloliquefaciens]
MSKRFIKFLAVSAVAAAANIGSRMLFGLWMGYVPSIVLAFGVGLFSGFMLNRALVFTEAESPVHHQIFWFIAVNLAAVVQTILASLLLARVVFPQMHFTWHPETVAHSVGVGIPAITSYLGHKHFTFRNRTATIDGR